VDEEEDASGAAAQRRRARREMERVTNFRDKGGISGVAQLVLDLPHS
jgi:hypothetical protein